MQLRRKAIFRSICGEEHGPDRGRIRPVQQPDLRVDVHLGDERGPVERTDLYGPECHRGVWFRERHFRRRDRLQLDEHTITGRGLYLGRPVGVDPGDCWCSRIRGVEAQRLKNRYSESTKEVGSGRMAGSSLPPGLASQFFNNCHADQNGLLTNSKPGNHFELFWTFLTRSYRPVI